MPQIRRHAGRRVRTVICAMAALVVGCASLGPDQSADTAQAVLPAAPEQVRAAVIQVLEEDGYRVAGVEEDRVLTTAYRREMDAPWNWLYRTRFGSGRSRVDVTLSPQGDQLTGLTIHVTYEGKDGLFESWKPYPAPLPQSAGNHLRLVKNRLGIL